MNAAQDSLITSNTQTIAQNKADQALTDAAQDVVIKTKAEQAYVDAADNELRTQINQKVERSDFETDQERQDNALKAEAERQDNVNSIQDTELSRLDEVKADKTDLAKTDANVSKNTESIAATNATISSMDERYSTINNTQNLQIGRNSENINKLGYKVNKMEKELNAGIANAIAFASLPTPPIAGKKMFTFGSGYHNGESAISVGFSGSSDTGAVSYKLGGSWSQEGGTSIGVGGGYMFD